MNKSTFVNPKFILICIYLIISIILLNSALGDYTYLGLSNGEITKEYDYLSGRTGTNVVRKQCMLFKLTNSSNLIGVGVYARKINSPTDLEVIVKKNSCEDTTPNITTCKIPASSIGTGYPALLYNCGFSPIVLDPNIEYAIVFNSEASTTSNYFFDFANSSKTDITSGIYSIYAGSWSNASIKWLGSYINFTSISTPDIINPILNYVSQYPSIINQSNLLNLGLNITYNITDNIAVNNATIYLNVSIENLGENITYYRNGTAIRGTQKYSYTNVNVSNFYQFSLEENQIYQGTYNHNESLMEITDKKYYDCNKSVCQYQIEVYNFTNKSVNIVELGIRDTGTPLQNTEVVLCNAPNVYNPLTNTTNCTLVFENNIFPSNHSHRGGKSNHSIFTFTFNTSNRMINGLYLPNVIYTNVIFNNNYPSNRYWSFAYIDGTPRTNSIKYWNSVTNQHTELNLSFDFHIHQIQPNQSKIFYYVCANDTSGNAACSSQRQTTIVTDYINPDSPIFYNPNVTNTYINNENLYISWNMPNSPMGSTGKSFELNISYANGSYETLFTDFTLPLDTFYSWNNVKNFTDGNLIIRYCDQYNYCSNGRSVNFTMLYYVIPVSDSALLININSSLFEINDTTNNIWSEVKMIGLILLCIAFVCVGIFTTQKYFIAFGGLVSVFLTLMSSDAFAFIFFLALSLILFVLGIGLSYQMFIQNKKENSFYSKFD